jgi:precorrin-3B synthase
MTALATAMRRNACPGLSRPMPTGDGLLVRLHPQGTIPLPAFAGLCAAARAYGNGVIEITSRGGIQARGLSAASAARFAASVATLAIAAEDGVPVHCNALAGIDTEELFDCGVLAAELRHALAKRSMTPRLAAKTSIAVDGGGTLDLAGLAADIRLCAETRNGAVALRVAVGGDATSAAVLGTVAPGRGVETVMRLLEVLARRGRDARARDIVATEGAALFRAAIVELLIPARPRGSADPAPNSRSRGNEREEASRTAIGLHRLRDGSFACGVGPAFGHADASALERLVEAARKAGANGLRTAPERALLAIKLTPQAAVAFAATAAQLGFVVRADDPRRHIVACAGAPICASAHFASRALAPLIAAQAAHELAGGFTIHLSGCAKGCALSAPADLTVVGTPDGCALIDHGSARDTPFAVTPASELPAAIAQHLRAQKPEADHV